MTKYGHIYLWVMARYLTVLNIHFKVFFKENMNFNGLYKTSLITVHWAIYYATD